MRYDPGYPGTSTHTGAGALLPGVKLHHPLLIIICTLEETYEQKINFANMTMFHLRIKLQITFNFNLTIIKFVCKHLKDNESKFYSK